MSIRVIIIVIIFINFSEIIIIIENYLVVNL